MTDNPFARHLQILRGIVDFIDSFQPRETDRERISRIFTDADPKVAEPDNPREWLQWAVPAIQEVLADHPPTTSTHSRNPDRSLRVRCLHEEDVDCDFPDEQGWRDHVSLLVAKRIGRQQDRAILALMHYRNR